MNTFIPNLLLRYGLIIGLGWMMAGQAMAQSWNLSVLHTFSAAGKNNTNADGDLTTGSLVLFSNTLYGATYLGGKSGVGAVFAVQTDGLNFTNLHSFSDGTDGANPRGSFFISSNTLYGSTWYGGTGGTGTIFKFNTDGTGYKVLYTFTINTTTEIAKNGDEPNGGLFLSGNLLYGTALSGGADVDYEGINGPYGTLFDLNVDTLAVTNLHGFTEEPDGANPGAGVIIANGILYGTTQNGGNYGEFGAGVVYSYNTDGVGGVSILHDFQYPTDGGGANNTLVISGNMLYGAASDGGAGSDGTVFGVSTDGVTFTNLYTFTATTTNAMGVYTNGDGAVPTGVILSGNTLYGVTVGGGIYGNGTMYSLTMTDSGVIFSNLYNFTASQTNSLGVQTNGDGVGPESLILSNNVFYGVAGRGGRSGSGTVFSLSFGFGTPPVLAINSPTPGQVETNQPAIYSSVTTMAGSSGAAVTNVWFQLNNGGWSQATLVFSNNWGASLEVNVGTNTLQAYCEDANGQISATNSVTFKDVITAGEAFSGPPGTPAAGTPGIGDATTLDTIAIGEGGGIGTQPITSFTLTEAGDYDAFAGDVVWLINTNNDINPTNWLAILRFINPADPTGTNGLPATEYETFFPPTISPNNFANFRLLPNVIYFPGPNPTTVSNNIVGTTSFFGPAGAIFAGELAIMVYSAAIQPGTGADLSISASALPEPVPVGTNLVYSLTVSNAGPSAAAGVVISNQIPAGVTFVSATGGAMPTNGVLVLNLGSLASGATDAVQIVVEPTVAGQLSNVFEVSANITDPVPSNNTVTVVSTVTSTTIGQGLPGTPLTITGTLAGGSVTSYNIISGRGPVDAGAGSSYTADTVTPGDLVVLADPTGGNNPTNWVVVARFFNPADPTGTNGLTATESEAFFSTNFGGAGFAGFKLFPNTYFTAASSSDITNNGITEILATDTQFGPVGVVLAGQTDITVFTIGTPLADLSLSASAVFVPTGSDDSSNLVYTLTVSNAGPAAATDVVISNQVPPDGVFISVTGGAAPTNGVLRVNLGSLDAGATGQVQLIEGYVLGGTVITNNVTNAFTVYADQPDPDPANNYTNIVTVINVPATLFTTSTRFEQTNLTASVKQTATNFTTELIAKLANGTVVYDMTFSNAFTDPAVTAAVTTAAGVLSGDGNGSYTGPTEKSFAKTFEDKTSVTVTNPIGTNITATVTAYVGPTNIFVGNGQTNVLTLPSGHSDQDTLVTYDVTNLLTTTLTSNYLNSAVYVMTGIVAQADVSLRGSVTNVTTETTLDYSLTVSNAGPATATGVVVSNKFPAGLTFVSATGGTVTTNNGILLVNIGSLAVGATNLIQIIMVSEDPATNVFNVSADETDPVPTNNSVTFITSDATTTTTSSGVTYETILASSTNQQATNYSTELIAKLPNGTVVYDQTFNVPYANAAVQTAVTTAAGDLTGDGATGYTGPVQTSSLNTLVSTSSVSVFTTNVVSFTPVTTTYIGPVTVTNGNLGTYERFATNAPYTGPTGGSPNFLNVVSGGEDIDTLVTVVLDIFQMTNNTVTNLDTSVYVMTGIVAAVTVDVALSVMAAPEPVDVGDPLTYSLTVTNNSTNTATGVVVTDTLPASVIFNSVLPSQGSATNHSGVVTYSVGSLPNGTAATLALVVVPTAAGELTNSAIAYSVQTDSQPANNSATNVTTAVSVAITNLVLTVLTDIALNPQTGLYEQQIEVSNGGPATPASVLVLISGLAANATVYNASGMSNGVPYVQSMSPLGVGSNVIFTVEYYVPTRVTPVNLAFTVVAGPAVTPPVVAGTILSISQAVILDGGDVLVEFGATPGRIYAIQYSSDMVTWRTAVPAIKAPGTQVQWIDSGPPKTDSSPAGQGARYYRVVLLN